MSTAVAEPTTSSEPAPGDGRTQRAANPVKILVGLVGMVVVVWAMMNIFLAFAFYPEKFG
jgi:alpha-glucoside transport system permease protein